MTVSEGAGLSEVGFDVSIDVETLRVSEKRVPITFILRNDRSTAVVSPHAGVLFPSDALFGSRDEHDDTVKELYVLNPNESATEPRIATILNDFRVEPVECFIIRIYFLYIPGEKEPLATCNEEGTNFFCEHTICIEDDDGKKRQMKV